MEKKKGIPDMTSKHSRNSSSKRWLSMSSVMELLNLSCSSANFSAERKGFSDNEDLSSSSESDGSSEEADGGSGDVKCEPEPQRLDSSAAASTADTEKLRMFVGTWNVGGRAPHAGLNLRDWLCTPAPADIYVLGFQEVVPLNAGNILVGENRGPASTWLDLIGHALNSPAIAPTCEMGPNTHPDQFPRPRVSFCDLISVEDMLEGADVSSRAGGRPGGEVTTSGVGYRLAASKQMVGIFLCVWVRADLLPHVSRIKVSCVARGMMGYTGNKGSISVSMTLRQTTFCFVCTHLASGEKEKDEVRRNSDVGEILRRTRFPRSTHRPLPPALAPKTILQHGKIIWLGDLNYRLSSSWDDANKLLHKKDWGALLDRDQLRIEQRAGRIFTGWEEGRIYFPPTYKYITNSDRYAVQTMETCKQKKRTPAWCDRILWRGDGMKQVCYIRGESRFSDHRPVYSIFSVRVAKVKDEDMVAVAYAAAQTNGKNRGQIKCHRLGWPVKTGRRSSDSECNSSSHSNSSSANSSSRVQAEEMFLNPDNNNWNLHPDLADDRLSNG